MLASALAAPGRTDCSRICPLSCRAWRGSAASHLVVAHSVKRPCAARVFFNSIFRAVSVSRVIDGYFSMCVMMTHLDNLFRCHPRARAERTFRRSCQRFFGVQSVGCGSSDRSGSRWWREWGAIVEDAKLRCALARLIERILKAAIYEYMLKSNTRKYSSSSQCTRPQSTARTIAAKSALPASSWKRWVKTSWGHSNLSALQSCQRAVGSAS